MRPHHAGLQQTIPRARQYFSCIVGVLVRDVVRDGAPHHSESAIPVPLLPEAYADLYLLLPRDVLRPDAPEEDAKHENESRRKSKRREKAAPQSEAADVQPEMDLGQDQSDLLHPVEREQRRTEARDDRLKDPDFLAWAQENHRTPTDAARESYDRRQAKDAESVVRRWINGVKTRFSNNVAIDSDLGADDRTARRKKGNYDEMPSAEEQRRIRDFDRKHPSIHGLNGRILLSKGETARIYNQLKDHGLAGGDRYGDDRDLFYAYTHRLDPETGSVATTVYACEYLGDNMFRPYGRLVVDGNISGGGQEALANILREKIDDRMREIGLGRKNNAGDMVVDIDESRGGGNDRGPIAGDGRGHQAPGIRGDGAVPGSPPNAGNGAATDAGLNASRDPNVRFLHAARGDVIGKYNRKTNEVTLYPGANAATVAHEIGWHATYNPPR